MQLSYLACLLCVTLRVNGNHETNNECSLPKLEDSDWNMFPDEWYQVLNVGDVFVREAPCWSFINAKETSKGVYVEFKHSYTTPEGFKKYDFVPVHWYTRGNSIDNLDPNYEFLWLDAAKKMGQKKDALKEIDSWYRTEVDHVSNYENYVMWLQCGKVGQRYIWVYTKTPQPTAEDILLVHNKLVEIGGGWDKVPLKFAGCVQSNVQN
ncbi:uncharacterized protein LOC144419983 [Styela clava]